MNTSFSLGRRAFLQRAGLGMGGLTLATMLGDIFASESPLTPRQPHFPAKAKHVIHIFAAGGPSQVDTWDPKPELTRFDNKTIPGHDGLAFGSPFKFNKMGKSGVEVSEVFPHLGESIDD